MKADICFSNDRQINDCSLKVKARTNLGFLKIEYDEELKVWIFWKLPLNLKRDKDPEEEDKKKKRESEEASEKKKDDSGGKKNSFSKKRKALTDNTKGLKAAAGHLIAILKKCRLRIKDTDLAFSAGTPDINGYITAVISILPAVYAPDVRIRPDFQTDDPYFDGHIDLYIRIYTFKILIELIKLLLDKDVRKLITEIKG